MNCDRMFAVLVLILSEIFVSGQDIHGNRLLQPDLQTNRTAFDIDDRLFSRSTIESKFNAGRQEEINKQPEQAENTIKPYDYQEHEKKSVDDLIDSYMDTNKLKSEPSLRKHKLHTHVETNDSRNDSDAHFFGPNPAIKGLSGFLEPTGILNKDQGKTEPEHGSGVHSLTPSHVGHVPAPRSLPSNYSAIYNHSIIINPNILEAVFGSSSASQYEAQQQTDTRPRGNARSTSLDDTKAFDIDDRLFSRKTIESKFYESRQEETTQNPEQAENTIETYVYQKPETKSVDNNDITNSEHSYVNLNKLKSEHKPRIPEDTNDSQADSDTHTSGKNPAITGQSGLLEPIETVNKDREKTEAVIEESTKEVEVRNNAVSKLDTKNASSRNVATFSLFVAILILIIV